jgi:hypothetical protein
MIKKKHLMKYSKSKRAIIPSKISDLIYKIMICNPYKQVCKVLRNSKIHIFTIANNNFGHCLVWFYWFIVFNATFSNISVISWQSVLLVEETRVPGENQ